MSFKHQTLKRQASSDEVASQNSRLVDRLLQSVPDIKADSDAVRNFKHVSLKGLAFFGDDDLRQRALNEQVGSRKSVKAAAVLGNKSVAAGAKVEKVLGDNDASEDRKTVRLANDALKKEREQYLREDMQARLNARPTEDMMSFPTRELTKLLSTSNEAVAPKAQRILGEKAAGSKARKLLGSSDFDEQSRKNANDMWTQEFAKRRRDRMENVLAVPVTPGARRITRSLRSDSKEKPLSKALSLLGDDELEEELSISQVDVKVAKQLGDSRFTSPKSRMLLGSSKNDGSARAIASKYWSFAAASKRKASKRGQKEFVKALDGKRSAEVVRHSTSTISSTAT